MNFDIDNVKKLKIAYIGGGSRGWAWTLMNDLTKANDMSGSVYLYDIDFNAALNNEKIGQSIVDSQWKYIAVKTIEEALTDANFVIISILPGSFNEMEIDIHEPEKYGIYQSVGDTTGPGGFFRALRTIPMIQKIARAIRNCCPSAWVINYTNPMSICVKTLYTEFPKIKAFGCCHEVFGTQNLLIKALEDIKKIRNVKRNDICVNVVGINHFTWFTEAHYHNIDLFEVYREFVDKYYDGGYTNGNREHWMNNSFLSTERVKFDLFKRFGYIAAAGDRHLAEFMDKEDYLESPECVKKWQFGLTGISWRREDLERRMERSRKLLSGEEKFNLKETGEEGVMQMNALLGLSKMVTNVNIPNMGQIPNLPFGAIVETNASLMADSLKPVYAGNIPDEIYFNVKRIVDEIEETVQAGISRDLNQAYKCFVKGHLISSLDDNQKRNLFNSMYDKTKKYLREYK